MFFIVKNRPVPIRIAFLADTHGVLDGRVAEVVADCDHAVHAGDVGNWDVVDSLRPHSVPILAVRGNNDTPAKWPVSQAARLASLPEQIDMQLPGGLLVVVHGHRHGGARQRHRRLRAVFPQARAVVYGHSHRLICDVEQSPWVLNPGAAGRARTYGGPSCLVLTITGDQWQVDTIRFAPAPRVIKTAAKEAIQ